MEWLAKRDQFPPLLLLRRYLKIAIELSLKAHLMHKGISGVPDVPFSTSAIPTKYPRPIDLVLWVSDA